MHQTCYKYNYQNFEMRGKMERTYYYFIESERIHKVSIYRFKRGYNSYTLIMVESRKTI